MQTSEDLRFRHNLPPNVADDLARDGRTGDHRLDSDGRPYLVRPMPMPKLTPMPKPTPKKPFPTAFPSVAIWDDEFPGHASLFIENDPTDRNDGYVSFWPVDEYSVKDGVDGKIVDAEPNPFPMDKASERNEIPRYIPVTANLDTEAMKAEWRRMKTEMRNRTLRYHGAGSNCTSAVARVLWAGVLARIRQTPLSCTSGERYCLYCFAGPREIAGLDRKAHLESLVACINRLSGNILRCCCCRTMSIYVGGGSSFAKRVCLERPLDRAVRGSDLERTYSEPPSWLTPGPAK